MMMQKYGFDEFGMTFGPREDGVYCDIDDYTALEQEKEELAEKVRELEKEKRQLNGRLNVAKKALLCSIGDGFDEFEQLKAENAELRKRLEQKGE